MSATPPSIAIAAPVLGGPEVVRVVLNSSSTGGCARARARCVEQQQHVVVRVVLNSSSSSTACVIAGCVSATPPSIAIAAPVLGGPEVVRVVLNSSSSSTWKACNDFSSVSGSPTH